MPADIVERGSKPGSELSASAQSQTDESSIGEGKQAPALITAFFISLFLTQIPRTVVNTQMDPSWGAVLAYAHGHGLQFGRDLVFPYGPLGFLFTLDFTGYAVNVRLLVDWLVSYWVAAGACLLAWRLSLGWRWVMLGFLVLSPANILPSQDLLLELGPLFWGLLCLTAAKRQAALYGVMLGLLVGVLGLIKFTSFLLGGLAIVAVLLDWMLQRQHRPAALMLGSAVGSFVVGWLVLGQSLLCLWAYAINSLALASGFNLAMAASAVREIRVGGVAAAVLTVLVIAARSSTWVVEGAAWPKLRRTLVLGWLFLAAFLSWKHGFVRADGHVAIFFGVAALLSLSLEVLPTKSRAARLVGHGAALAVCLLTCTTLDWMFPGAIDQRPDRALRRLSSNLRTLIRPSTYRREMRLRLEQERAHSQLPFTRSVVSNRTVDVFGQNQAYAIFNDLNYHPRPVFQSYCAYSHRLMQLNENSYAGATAPSYVLFNLSPLDERLPTMEDSGSLRTLLSRYRLAGGEGLFLLLERTNAPAPVLTFLRAGMARPGEILGLPEAQTNDLWMELSFPASWFGRLQRLFYQPPGVRLRPWYGADAKPGKEFSTPPLMLAAGFIVSPLLLNNFDVVDLYAGQSNARPVAVSLEVPPHDRASFQDTFHFRLYRFNSRLGGTPDPGAERWKWPGFKTSPTEGTSPFHPMRLTTVGGRPAVFIHPWGHLGFSCPAGAARLTGAYGFEESAYNPGTTDGAEFRVEWHSQEGGTRLLWSRLLEPKTKPEDRGLQRLEVSLPRDRGEGKLWLVVLPGPHNDTAWDLTCWSQIEIK